MHWLRKVRKLLSNLTVANLFQFNIQVINMPFAAVEIITVCNMLDYIICIKKKNISGLA
jgi:hypothetical protein